MKRRNQWMVLVLILATGLQLVACSSSGTGHHEEPAHIVPIDGTDLSRIELTQKAAERIAVQTVAVREEQVVRTRRYGGQVVDTGDDILVRVSLGESDLSRVDRDEPVVAWPLEEGTTGWKGEVVEAPDPADGTKALFCRMGSSASGLAVDQRVYVEVTLLGNEMQEKIIPYAAVLYDVHGETWAYTAPKPLEFVRAPIVVDYIEGDLAVLSEGPAVGTEIVTAGASELFGAESGIGGGGH